MAKKQRPSMHKTMPPQSRAMVPQSRARVKKPPSILHGPQRPRDKRERKCFAEMAKILRTDDTATFPSHQLFRINSSDNNDQGEVWAEVNWYTGCWSRVDLPEERMMVRSGVYVAKTTWYPTPGTHTYTRGKDHMTRTRTHVASLTNLRCLGSTPEVLRTLDSDLGTPKYWPRLLAQYAGCLGTTKGDMLMDMLTFPWPE